MTACVKRFGVLFTGVFLLTSAATGYEVNTHRNISGTAYDQSILGQGYLLTELGLPKDQVFASGRKRLDAQEWIQEGSEREDDLLRPLNHFYDPVGDRGLTVRGFVGQKAPDWAFEQPTENPPLRLGWTDARQSFLEGLTARTTAVRDAGMALTFRALGDVIHLIQDMGSPEHVRNDPHLGLRIPGTNLHPAGAASLFEQHIDSIRDSFTYTGYVTPAPDTFRGFWTTGDGGGFAEFSNRNFISKSTNFTQTVQNTTGTGYSLPTLDLNLKEEVDVQSLSPEAQAAGITGKVTFFGNVLDDRLTGDQIFNRRMTTYSLFDSHLRVRGHQEIFSINRYTVEAAAPILLPRAVGYSAGLIDYFFRGKLDVDLVEVDDLDPSIIQLKGTNASTEKLDGGTLKLYADDPQGRRSAVTSSDPSLTVTADRGKPVTSARFTAPTDAERFVAVYTGTLGNEEPGADPQTAPGAVIGKVLGGQRVEEVFSDGTRWQLRTPDGVFPLPILASDIEDLRWGDVDNTLVGRSRLGLDAPNIFRAYEINRPAGSTLVPTKPNESGTLLVDVAATPPVTLSPELPTGTSVRFHGSARVTQDLATFEGGARSFGYDPETDEYVPLGRPDGRPEASLGTEISIDRVVDETRTVTADFAILLTPATYEHPGGLNYSWRVVEIGLDATGRMLALVEVILTEPANANGSVPLKRHHALTGALESAGAQFARVSFGFSRLLLALIDVKAQQVVATTADTEVVLRIDRVVPLLMMQAHMTAEAHGGPFDGQLITRWFELPLRIHVDPPRPGDEVEEPFVANVTVTQDSGLTSLQTTGRYKPALAALVPSDLTIQELGPVRQQYLFAITGDGSGLPLFKGFNVDTTFFGLSGYSATLAQGQRLRPSPAGELLLLFTEPIGINEGDEGVLVRLPPEAGGTLARLPRELPAASRHHLVGTTSKRALVVSQRGPTEATSRLVDLDTGGLTEFPGDDLGEQFVVLDPTRLYHVQDLRFYRPRPPLLKTALPRKLADVSGNPVGDYHTIEVK